MSLTKIAPCILKKDTTIKKNYLAMKKFSQIKNSVLLFAVVLTQTSAFLTPGRARDPSPVTAQLISEKNGSPMRMSVEGPDDEEDVKETKEALKDVAYEANDAVSEAADDAKEAIDPDRYDSEKSLLEKAKEKTISAKDTVKEKAGDLKDKIGDGIESVGESIKGEEN